MFIVCSVNACFEKLPKRDVFPQQYDLIISSTSLQALLVFYSLVVFVEVND